MYDEREYIAAVDALRRAVARLVRNEISAREIVELTMSAIVGDEPVPQRG